MRTFTINRWDNDKEIFSCKAKDMRDCVEKAIKKGISLAYAKLLYANLSSANLSSAKLLYADLSSANLSSANLSSSDLSSSDLSYANLSSSDLSYANLSSSDLSSADLRSADLSSANLRYAKLDGIKCVNPVMMLLAYHNISDKICLELMRYDCDNLPNGRKLFDKWKKTDDCPYDNTSFVRVANFLEKKSLWSYRKSKTALQIWLMIKKFNRWKE